MRAILTSSIIILIPLLLVGLVIAYNVTTWMEWTRLQKLSQEGMSTQAVIIKLDSSIGLKAPNTYFVRYQYTTSLEGKDQNHTVRRTVDESLYQRLSEGTEVLIRYLPEAPGISDIQGNQAFVRRVLVCLSINGAFFLFLISLLIRARSIGS